MSERSIEAGFFSEADLIYQSGYGLWLPIGHANALLRAWLAEQPEVFGEARDEDGVNVCQEWDVLRHKTDTHTARLVGVREIGK